jgi:hypothetical protein
MGNAGMRTENQKLRQDLPETEGLVLLFCANSGDGNTGGWACLSHELQVAGEKWDSLLGHLGNTRKNELPDFVFCVCVCARMLHVNLAK